MSDESGKENERLVLDVKGKNPNRVASLVQVGTASPIVIDEGEAIDLEAALEVSEEIRITADDLRVGLTQSVGERLHRNFRISDLDSVIVRDLATGLDACVDFNATSVECEIIVIMNLPVAVDPIEVAPIVASEATFTMEPTVARRAVHNMSKAVLKLETFG